MQLQANARSTAPLSHCVHMLDMLQCCMHYLVSLQHACCASQSPMAPTYECCQSYQHSRWHRQHPHVLSIDCHLSGRQQKHTRVKNAFMRAWHTPACVPAPVECHHPQLPTLAGAPSKDAQLACAWVQRLQVRARTLVEPMVTRTPPDSYSSSPVPRRRACATWLLRCCNGA